MLLAVVRHFGDFAEDQFDFHSYSIRKMTLRAYVAMLRMQDTLRGNAFFAKVGAPPWRLTRVGMGRLPGTFPAFAPVRCGLSIPSSRIAWPLPGGFATDLAMHRLGCTGLTFRNVVRVLEQAGRSRRRYRIMASCQEVLASHACISVCS